MASVASVQKLIGDLFTTGNPAPIYEAFWDKDKIDVEVLASIAQNIKKANGNFSSVDVTAGPRTAFQAKFSGQINLEKGSVKFEISLQGDNIQQLSFGLGQGPESITTKLVASRGVEFIKLFFAQDAGARALMAEIFCEQLPERKFREDARMETSRIGFGQFTNVKADVTGDTVALETSSGVPSAKVDFIVEFASATTKADLTFGINGLRAEITDYNFTTSLISGGKMAEGSGKKLAAQLMKLLLAKETDQFLSGSLHRDMISMFDPTIFAWHVKDVVDSMGALKGSINEETFQEEIDGNDVRVFGSVEAQNSNVGFCFEWNKCIMTSFNWGLEDNSVYQRSSIELSRSFFEGKTTAFLETTKSSWIGSADEDIMPDLRNTDDMNRKKLDLRELLCEINEPLNVEYVAEDPEAKFSLNAFERIVALPTKIKIGNRVLDGTVTWFVDKLRAYITDFEFTKTAEDSRAPIDISELSLAADSKEEDEKYEKMKKFDFNWDD